jgi:ATP-dependent protease HslVU (ClpYQ) peptidase subunit
MTCIVGVCDGSSVYLAGERALSVDDWVSTSAHPKVWRRDSVAFGVAGQLAQLQKLRYQLQTPRYRGGPPENYLGKRLCPALHEFFGGELEIEILVGMRGRLFAIDDACAFAEVSPEWAIGSGGEAARAALKLLSPNDNSPRARCSRAVLTAAEVCQSVGGPVDLVSA